MITKEQQKAWFIEKARELVEALAAAGCNALPCVECPFSIPELAKLGLSNCAIQRIEAELIDDN